MQSGGGDGAAHGAGQTSIGGWKLGIRSSWVLSQKVTLDEVLVNGLLDVCVRLRNVRRLTTVLEQFKARGVVPSLHAGATFIGAYGHARRLDPAWVLWRELTEE